MSTGIKLLFLSIIINNPLFSQCIDYDYESTIPNLFIEEDLYHIKNFDHYDSIFILQAHSIPKEYNFKIDTLKLFNNLKYLYLDESLKGNLCVLCDLNDLMFLQYYGNSFDFPNCLLKSQKLEHLSFRLKKNKKIPDFSKIENLVSINFFPTSKKQIDDFFDLNLNLKYLSIELNYKGNFDIKKVCKFSELSSLNIYTEFNDFIPENFKVFTKLQNLSLNLINISISSINILSSLPSLKQLSLQTNIKTLSKIESINFSAFKHLKCLKIWLNDDRKEDKNYINELNNILKKQLPDTEVNVIGLNAIHRKY